MTPFVCATCGTWFAESSAPPTTCPICEDDRQYVPREGQQWTIPKALSAAYENRIEEDDGVMGIGMMPAFAINQRCAIIEAVAGRVLWEATSLVTRDAAEAILADGPIAAIAISHPHFYAAMHEWADALGTKIFLPEIDRVWIQRPSHRITFWDGESIELLPGVTLIRCGGHFEGSSVLHWQDYNCPEGALFVGDTLQVAADRKRVSAMHSYPNAIPLSSREICAIEASLNGLDFEKVYGFTWGRNILSDGKGRVVQSLKAYREAIAPAGTESTAGKV